MVAVNLEAMHLIRVLNERWGFLSSVFEISLV